MGNDQSQLKGLEIDKKAIEVTDYWTTFAAEIVNDNRVNKITIFQGETIIDANLWGNNGPLEKSTKNLMIYRHPCILKYITSWNRGSTKILATESCRPLSLVLGSQTEIEICLGLKSILSALIFLVEQAGVRHLNVSTSSIYVTEDGTWKLGGFEFLWKTTELNENILERTKHCRYNKAIDSNEVKNKGLGLEQYAFGVLCEETLQRINDDNTPFLKQFKLYCSTHLKHSTSSMRPKLSAILLHSYFNHEFITIHSFLSELPLKNQQEKQQFFTGLIDRLRKFDEIIVASQLANTLLSRIVLLDSSAQLCVLPYLLKPKTDDIVPSLFTVPIFEKFIIPKLKQVFCVRDTQIRLILLEYFNFYINLFSKDDLKENILPQLLLGIKDRNDILVATTLRCLADLVGILGSEIVIGSNRLRIFADGRPQGPPEISNHWIEARSITPVLTSVEFASNSPIPDNVDISESASIDNISNGNLMPERLSPDGGEDFKNSEIDDETWTDWEEELIDENLHQQQNNIINNTNDLNENEIIINNNENLIDNLIPKKVIETINQFNRKSITEIDELDIKNQKVTKKHDEEMDFFKDMEPIIQKTNILILEEKNNDVDVVAEENNIKIDDEIDDKNLNSGNSVINLIDKSRFDIKVVDDNEDGWEDETDNNVWGNDV